MRHLVNCVVCLVFFTSVVFVNGQIEEETGLEANEGLSCYACYGIGPDNDCEKYEPYRRAREDDDTDGPVTLKTCTAPYNKSCMIETYKNDKGDVVHIRDCSDDKTFDFTEIMTNASSYQRLLELKDNNETACVWDSSYLVCLSKCAPQSVNETANFCNGPYFAHAFTNSFSVTTILCSLVFINVLRLF